MTETWYICLWTCADTWGFWWCLPVLPVPSLVWGRIRLRLKSSKNINAWWAAPPGRVLRSMWSVKTAAHTATSTASGTTVSTVADIGVEASKTAPPPHCWVFADAHLTQDRCYQPSQLHLRLTVLTAGQTASWKNPNHPLPLDGSGVCHYPRCCPLPHLLPLCPLPLAESCASLTLFRICNLSANPVSHSSMVVCRSRLRCSWLLLFWLLLVRIRMCLMSGLIFFSSPNGRPEGSFPDKEALFWGLYELLLILPPYAEPWHHLGIHHLCYPCFCRWL